MSKVIQRKRLVLTANHGLDVSLNGKVILLTLNKVTSTDQIQFPSSSFLSHYPHQLLSSAMNTHLLPRTNKRSILFLSLSSLLRTRAFSPLGLSTLHSHFGSCQQRLTHCKLGTPESGSGQLQRAIFARGGALFSTKEVTMANEVGAGEKLGRMRAAMDEYGVHGAFLWTSCTNSLVVSLLMLLNKLYDSFFLIFILTYNSLVTPFVS